MAKLDPAPKPPTREIGSLTNTPPPPTVGGPRLGMGWGNFIQEGENVPELRWPQSIRWFEEMLFADSMINQMYMSLVMPLSEYVWALNPNGADATLTQKLADDLGLPVGLPTQDEEDEYEIQPGLFSFNFLQHAEEALLAVPFGHYFFEKVGPVADDGLWHIEKLAPRHPATIMQMYIEANGDLTSIRQYHSPDGFTSPPEPIPYTSLVPYVWRGDARAKWIGRPMLRPIYRSWLIRDILIRVDAINHERAGGVPGVETDHTFDGTNLNDLQALAASFRVGEDSGYALPPGAKLVLNKLGGTDVVRSLEYHDNQIAGQWRSMVEQLGQTATGNRALGQTFAGLQDLAQRAIARWFSAVFREQVIRFWWDVNVPRKSDGSLPPHPLLAWRVPKGSATDPVAPNAPPTPLHEAPTANVAPVGGSPGPPPVAAAGLPSPRRSGGNEAGTVGSATAKGALDGIRTGGAPPPRASGGPGVSARGTDAPPADLHRFPPDLRRQPTPVEIAAKTDFAGLQHIHTQGEADAVRLLNGTWLPGLAQQAADQIAALGASPSPAKLAKLPLTPPDAAELHDILLAVAQRAADGAGAELAAQSIAVREAKATAMAKLIKGQADAMAAQVANGVSLAAGRKAVQLTSAAITVPSEEIAAGVMTYLDGLAHAWERDQIVGAVSQATNAGRFTRFALIEQPATYYASELLDDATCDNCDSIDGTEYQTLDAAISDYSGGGYNDCLGGARCRGTIVATAAGEV